MVANEKPAFKRFKRKIAKNVDFQPPPLPFDGKNEDGQIGGLGVSRVMIMLIFVNWVNAKMLLF